MRPKFNVGQLLATRLLQDLFFMQVLDNERIEVNSFIEHAVVVAEFLHFNLWLTWRSKDLSSVFLSEKLVSVDGSCAKQILVFQQ